MSVNNFGLFFTRDGAVIRLPVNPEKLPVARDTENGDYNVLGIGQIMVCLLYTSPRLCWLLCASAGHDRRDPPLRRQ